MITNPSSSPEHDPEPRFVRIIEYICLSICLFLFFTGGISLYTLDRLLLAVVIARVPNVFCIILRPLRLRAQRCEFAHKMPPSHTHGACCVYAVHALCTSAHLCMHTARHSLHAFIYKHTRDAALA